MTLTIVQTEMLLPYTCAACGFGTSVEVRAAGLGGAGGQGGSGNASADADQAAVELLRAVRCPRCGDHDALLRARLIRKRKVMTWSFTALPAVAAIATVASGGPIFVAGIFAALGLMTYAIGRELGNLRWPDPEDRVRFMQ